MATALSIALPLGAAVFLYPGINRAAAQSQPTLPVSAARPDLQSQPEPKPEPPSASSLQARAQSLARPIPQSLDAAIHAPATAASRPPAPDQLHDPLPDRAHPGTDDAARETAPVSSQPSISAIAGANTDTDTDIEPGAAASGHALPDLDALPPAPGLIFDLRHGHYIPFDEMLAQLAQTRFILIGEQHDNPIHHHHQAQLVNQLTARDGMKRAVVWEMFERDEQERLDQAWRDVTPAELGNAMDWADSGWPSWHDYAPIADAAHQHALPMVAGNLPRSVLKPMISDGVAALPDDLRNALALPEIPVAIARRFDREIIDSHCGMLPGNLAPAFSTVQFARDASMARAMLDTAPASQGAFLIAGAMHVRRHIAVPYHLGRFDPALDPTRDIAIVTMMEADAPGNTDITAPDYALRIGDPDVADFLWFTNDLPRSNPCDGMKPVHKPDADEDEDEGTGANSDADADATTASDNDKTVPRP